jgi:superfamily II DNA or RNA helicase
MTAPQLRPYQLRVEGSIFDAWDGGMIRPAISISTGGGKSVIFGSVARRHLSHHRGAGPVVLLAHRRELITQAAGHFARANPDLRVATVIGSPGPERSTRRAKALSTWHRADVLVSTVQTLASRSTMAAFPDPSLIICDEAHHFAADMFKRVLTSLGAFSGTRTLGVTATPFREDHRDFSDIFEAIVASIDISWLITHADDGAGGEKECAPGAGYLVPPQLRHLIVDGLDLSEVPTSMRSGAVDFREAELAQAMTDSGAFDIVAEAVVSELAGVRSAIFAPTVASSRYLSERINALGGSCGHVDGMMSTTDRDRVIGDFRNNKITYLSNVGIIGEGFDIPEIGAVVLARPTKSRIFFRQAIGRALRPAPGKTHAIVLDVAGASDGHTLVGIESLTDHEVLTAQHGESLIDLLDRSTRARQGRLDRITAHIDHAREVQERAERGVEQMRLTAEGLARKLPGLVEFVQRAEPLLPAALDHTTAAIDRGLQANREQSLDDLSAAESYLAEEVAAARGVLGRLEDLKDGMREALAALREEPEGEVARAMVTGYVGTVRGQLFGEGDEHYTPPAPGEVQGLKMRGGPRSRRPSHPARYGWAFRTGAGHLWIPVHAEAGHNMSGMTSRAEVTALLVAVSTAGGWRPVIQVAKTGAVDELSGPLRNEDDAYRLIVQRAAEASGAVNLIDPNASWRRRESAPGAPARAVARRVAPHFEIPDDATAGFVGDVITVGQYQSNVDGLGAWVAQQTPA